MPLQTALCVLSRLHVTKFRHIESEKFRSRFPRVTAENAPYVVYREILKKAVSPTPPERNPGSAAGFTPTLCLSIFMFSEKC